MDDVIPHSTHHHSISLTNERTSCGLNRSMVKTEASILQRLGLAFKTLLDTPSDWSNGRNYCFVSPEFGAILADIYNCPLMVSKAQTELSKCMVGVLRSSRPNSPRSIVTACLAIVHHSCSTPATPLASSLTLMPMQALQQARQEIAHVSPHLARDLRLGGKEFPELELAQFLDEACGSKVAQCSAGLVVGRNGGRSGGGEGGSLSSNDEDTSVRAKFPTDVVTQSIIALGVGVRETSTGKRVWGPGEVVTDIKAKVQAYVSQLRGVGHTEGLEPDWPQLVQMVAFFGGEEELGLNPVELVAAAFGNNEWSWGNKIIRAAMAASMGASAIDVNPPSGRSQGQGAGAGAGAGAVKVKKNLSQPSQELGNAFIRLSIHHGRRDLAVGYMREWGRELDFPELVLEQRQQKLAKIVKRGQWALAGKMAHNAVMREWLVRHLVEVGELRAAIQLRKEFRLESFVPEISLEEAKEQELARRANQLSLGHLHPQAVVIVDSLATLERAGQSLACPPAIGEGGEGVRCVGLDVEWPPTGLDFGSGARHARGVMGKRGRAVAGGEGGRGCAQNGKHKGKGEKHIKEVEIA
ncbi:unnamed protein product, partial [Choristocarpus tenellus]